ncbi:MAG: hypothetical protein CMP23_03095 [Rickettsiales bacterium]|nr:hypothetical protein [Rickettsiales bacterium]
MKLPLRLFAAATLLCALGLQGCQDGGAPEPLSFTPDSFTAPNTVPGLVNSAALRLTNSSGATYQLTRISISAAEAGAAERFSWMPPQGVLMPLELAPGESIDLQVFFSPLEAVTYEATLTAQLWMLDYEIGGGGCSSGCGREAPASTEAFATVVLTGTGDTDASFEDCADGVDNDDDQLIDCEDPDCLTFPGCAPGSEDCTDGEDNDGDQLTDCEDPDCRDHPDCSEDPIELCDDGIDNDGDGLIDCDDSDCSLSPDCVKVVGCSPQGELGCDISTIDSTETGQNQFDQYCDSDSGGWDGPEHIWSFFTQRAGAFEVTARRIQAPSPGGPGDPDDGWDLDLTVLIGAEDEETEGGVTCDPTECIGTSWGPPEQEEETVILEAEPGQLFFIVVDGWDGAAGTYELSIECASDPDIEEDCSDGLDNDGDGDFDCEDSDCNGDPDCGGSGGCQPLDSTLSCQPGSEVNSANNDSGSTQLVEDWCDEGLDGWTGPEIAFAFSPAVSGDVEVRLDDLTADLDLMVLLSNPAAEQEDSCSPEFCVTSDDHWRPGAQPETVTFQAFTDTTYIIAVDGWDDAISNFSLSLDCPAGPTSEFDCEDNIDNDGDGLVDCNDDECIGAPNCSGVPEICNDGVDNDGDADTDCDDIEDCNLFPGCDYGDGDCCANNGTPGCDNNLGEDCVCAIDAFCCEGAWDAICIDLFSNSCGGTCSGPETETICDDGIDDDSDGLVDCDDADCFIDPQCQIPSTEGDCDNSFDDDLDGATDCDDSDCLLDPNCLGPTVELDCENNLDDDSDGLTDCNDGDCAASPACQGPGVEQCNNNLDDDGDGLVDCDDADCFADPICLNPNVEDCQNSIDDDGDGAVDCDDAECTFEPACDSGGGDCCTANGTPGCSDEPGEDCVCAADPYCCNNLWDSICANTYQVTCGGVCTGVEDCSNGLDDDFDGLTDCADDDCVGAPNCGPPSSETSCTDGVDNDQDGATDCADSDCSADPACAPPPTESDCGNQIDDDSDNLIDCADSDCAADPLCNLPGTETNCADSIDNDADGRTDCSDVDCVADPNCNIFVIEVNCFDGLDNDSDGDIDCDDSDCAALPSCSLSPETNCNNGIDDDADSFTDCNDSDCATDPSCASGESDCDDSVDNDGDGDIDCDDNDCSAATECITTGDCNPIGNIGCGDVITGSNDMAGSTDQQTEFCGNPLGPGWSGPEVAWVFSPQDDGLVDITLTDLSEDLDIMVLVQDSDGCDENDCEASGWNPPPQPEQMDWYAFSGTPYYIVIDGWNGAVSDFTMTVTCTPSSETECGDGVDNDQDGDIDCADSDCLGNLACPETACSDLIDNDADGFADCADPDCAAQAQCLPELNCIDGLDNDLDGSSDCDDSDCANATICQPETNCNDGLDNDLDGSSDCADSDCATDPTCAGLQCSPSAGSLTCDDTVIGDTSTGSNDIGSYCGGTSPNLSGPELYYTLSASQATTMTVSLSALSEDLDLLALLRDGQGACLADNCVQYNPELGTAAESIELSMTPGLETQLVVDGYAGASSLFLLNVTCAPPTSAENCTDGLDNDGDGDEDCFDSDCAAEPSCSNETICDDGFDNDADGLADCNDSDCFGTPGCPLVLFSSVGDDPNDFFAFQLPDHNSSSDWELGAPDSSAQSGSGPTTAVTGSLAWCTGCDQRAHAQGQFESALVAQPLIFDLSGLSGGTLELSWHHWLVVPSFPNLDSARIEVSDDGGSSTDTLWGPTIVDTAGWEQATIDLSTYIGGDLTFSFVYDSVPFGPFGGGSNSDGWYIEDVELVWYP